MHNCIKHIIKGVFLLTVILAPVFSWGQEKSAIRFIENKGQLPDQADFKLKTNAGDIYLEGTTMTYCLYDKSLFTDIHHNKISIEDAAQLVAEEKPIHRHWIQYFKGTIIENIVVRLAPNLAYLFT